jgi:hypothetical protein
VRGARSRRLGATCRTVTRSIKLIRILVGFVDRPGGPKTAAVQGFWGAGGVVLAGLLWGWGGCNVFQVAARETAKSW